MIDNSRLQCDPFIQVFDPGIRNICTVPEPHLRDLRFGVKDNFDISGHVTGGGTTEWANSDQPAQKNAMAVDILLQQGAIITGKTHMDELAYSLMGMNAQYGTPLNPNAPDRVPGGSSSGSASAVASGQVDAAIGTDTGGSVRIPASFCGIYGLRPSHGRINCSGLLALAPSFDTVGFFARDPATMMRIGQAYNLADNIHELKVLMPEGIWTIAENETTHYLMSALPESLLPPVSVGFGELFNSLDSWRRTFQTIQAYEIWQVFGDWIINERPNFGPGVRERFKLASKVTQAQWHQANRNREAIRERIFDLLGNDRVLVIPTAPGPSPLLTADQVTLERYRNAALSILCIAGLCGLPQLSIPLTVVAGAPVGVSLVGPYGTDGALLKMAVDLATAN